MLWNGRDFRNEGGRCTCRLLNLRRIINLIVCVAPNEVEMVRIQEESDVGVHLILLLLGAAAGRDMVLDPLHLGSVVFSTAALRAVSSLDR